MNVLERIQELREERHWTEYQLAQESDLTQSTISSWYRKNMVPSIPSLTKVCKAFHITLSQFFLEEDTDTITLTPVQMRLVSSFSKLNEEQGEALLKFLEQL